MRPIVLFFALFLVLVTCTPPASACGRGGLARRVGRAVTFPARVVVVPFRHRAFSAGYAVQYHVHYRVFAPRYY